MTRSGQALMVVIAWAGVLTFLAAAWIQSPFTGPGPMFLGWSLAAAALTVGMFVWLEKVGDTHVPRGPKIQALILVGWLFALWAATSGFGPELALDGMILRNPAARGLGLALGWVPGVFGLALSVAGLVAALEARYRITHV